MRHNTGCPMPLAHTYLGERFGKWPWEVEEAPADKVEYYFAVMSCEAEYDALYEGTDPDELFEMGGED